MKRTLEERFWEKVDKKGPDDCWEWTAGKLSRGYGRIKINGKEQYAHRVSWELANGPIPDGMCVLHRCDNPSCVNPAHLFLGTQGDNVYDMHQKGRAPDLRGERNGRARISREDVHKIREMISQGISQTNIARQYEVTKQEINNINTGVSWGWLK